MPPWSAVPPFRSPSKRCGPSRAGRPAVAVALVVADLGWQTEVFERLSWNPSFGLVFLVAAMAAAWVVATGRFGWWPATVFFASVSAQCHLVYAAPALALAAFAPVTALALGRRPGRWRWLAIGLVVTAICWTAPLVQELTTRPGNLSLLLRSDSATSPVGLGFGWHALATATAPRPIWLTGFPFLVSFEGQMSRYLRAHSVGWAVVASFLLVAIVVVACRTHRHRLSALAVMALVTSAGVVVSFSAFPADNLGPVGYLAPVLWLVGMVVWITVAWAVGELAGAVAGRWRAGERPRRALRASERASAWRARFSFLPSASPGCALWLRRPPPRWRTSASTHRWTAPSPAPWSTTSGRDLWS